MPRRRDPTLALGTPTSSETRGHLVLLGEKGEIRRLEVGDTPIRIGKSRDAELSVADPHVSRMHAEVLITEEGVVVRDLGSRNGTFVSGIPIKEAVLTDGAIISCGKTRVRFEAESAVRAEDAPSFGPAVAGSDAMKQVFQMLEKLAPADVTVLLIGETGSGKDVLARALHARSPRVDAPFVVFDCGAVAPNLIESELFGHERGAFTGAVAEREGAFERAHKGTLFLDEIGEMPLPLQTRLLRALEQREVQRLGGASPIAVDVRVIGATNRDLSVEVQEGRFRQDLFFRLSAAVVQVPPLRDRMDDLPILVTRILEELGRPVKLSPSTLAALRSYDWPGNVRELKNVITSAVAFMEGPSLEPRHLMFFNPRRREPTLDRLPLGGRTLQMIERAAIKQTLEQEKGNKSRAARALGIAPSTLYEKIKKYDL